MKKRIAIVGTGANGGAVGADLTRAGLDVTFIEQWPEHVEVMRERGLRVETPEGTLTTDVKAIHLCEVATLRRRFDIVFVGVKAYDTRWACELIKSVLATDGLVVGLQNGMTIDDVASIVGPARTIGVAYDIAGNIYVPGIIQRETPASGSWFGIGPFDDATRGREAEVADILSAAGQTEIIDDIRSAKWMKLATNAAEVFPSAILNLPLADAAAIPEVRNLMIESGAEALRTAVALGNRIVPIFGRTAVPTDDLVEYSAILLDAVLAEWSSPTMKVASLQDWLKGRRAEIDEMNGTVVREQERLGGQVPVNRHIVDLARAIERGELEPDPANVDRLVQVMETTPAG